MLVGRGPPPPQNKKIQKISETKIPQIFLFCGGGDPGPESFFPPPQNKILEISKFCFGAFLFYFHGEEGSQIFRGIFPHRKTNIYSSARIIIFSSLFFFGLGINLVKYLDKNTGKS